MNKNTNFELRRTWFGSYFQHVQVRGHELLDLLRPPSPSEAVMRIRSNTRSLAQNRPSPASSVFSVVDCCLSGDWTRLPKGAVMASPSPWRRCRSSGWVWDEGTEGLESDCCDKTVPGLGHPAEVEALGQVTGESLEGRPESG